LFGKGDFFEKKRVQQFNEIIELKNFIGGKKLKRLIGFLT
jgi:hypothetical protein